MSPRKSPYKHDVKKHTRNKRPVRNYVRGKGGQLKKVARRHAQMKRSSKSKGGKTSMFDFTVFYDGISEKLTVKAKDYLNSINEGLELREKITAPSKIRIREVRS